MARQLRVHFPGAVYHVTGRMLGSWKEDKSLLFCDDRDRKRFVARLEQVVADFEVRIFLFCLMSNHFHLLLETPKGNLSRFMQSLNTSYTVYFNRRHIRHGHVLDGRYKAKLVAKDEYLLKLSRYIHLNPVTTSWWKSRPIADRIRRLRSYVWSSYPGYCGAKKPYEFVDKKPLMALAGVHGGPGSKGIREYVESGLARSDEELEEVLREAHLGIGDQSFRVMVQKETLKIEAGKRKKEDISFRKVLRSLPASKVLGLVAETYGVMEEELRMSRKGSFVRPTAARCLIRYAGLSQREAAVHLGVSTGAAISVQIKRLNEREGEDRKLARRLKKLESRIREEIEEAESGC